MHLYIITRGIKNWADQFITELQGKYLPFKFPDEKGELRDVQIQVAVRPIQLYEVVFPEDHKDLMLNTLLGPEKSQGEYRGFGKGKNTQHSKHDKFIWGIRKILGCEKIPKYKSDIALPITRLHTEVVGIGIKKDRWTDTKTGLHYDKKENENCFEAL